MNTPRPDGLLCSITRLEAEDPDRRDTIVVRISRDVDLLDVRVLDRLLPLTAWGERVHLDVSDLRTCGASFLGWLVRLAGQAEATGCRLTLGATPPRFARLLHLTGLAGLIERGGALPATIPWSTSTASAR